MLNFLINPNSFRGNAQSLIAKLEKRLKAAGAEYRFFFSEKEGGIGKYTKSLTTAEENPTLIAVGGDGTLNEVLTNIADPARCTLGLIPAGTGNDFAAALKIPKGPKALDLILNTEPQPIDYLECGDGRRCINIAGLGMDVDILNRRIEARMQGKRMSYFKSLLISLKKYRGLGLTVYVDGKEEHYNCLIATLCNGSQFGGGIRICPVADPADGKLELLVIEYPKNGKVFRELVKLMRGKILERKISHRVSCTSARIVPETPQFVQYDGEIFATEELSASIVSGKLKMFRG